MELNKEEKYPSKLEKFVLENRKEMDKFEVPSGLWEKMLEELDEEEEEKPSPKVIQIRHTTLWRVAAAAIALIAVVYVAFQTNLLNINQDQTIAQKEIKLEQINPQLAETEAYYTKLISEKKEEIKEFSKQNLKVTEDFKNDLAELDKMYESLKEDLYKVPGKDQVVDAMIVNLQMRIKVLNQQLEILKKIQNFKNGEKNEKVSL